MKSTNPTAILSSFATLKSLNDSKNYRSSYQLLGEFISYIIFIKKLYSFTSVQMKHHLREIFDFDIPEAVITTAAKKLPFSSLNDGVFIINASEFSIDKTLEVQKAASESINSTIIKKMCYFIKEKEPNKEIDIEALNKDLVAFLVDDQQRFASEYTNLISEFILKHQSDDTIQNGLSAIREGSILYIGINYNINETGSLRKQLNLFLDTEVLFSLVGYNGTIYKILAQDFYNQIRNANMTEKKICLYYLSDVKKEIDRFFSTAELIVERKCDSNGKIAMDTIVSGCKSASDIKVKYSDFFQRLKYGFGIVEKDPINFYDEENNPYNLESPDYATSEEQEGWKFVSHINKLRKGKVYQDNIESEYLYVTNTSSTLKASKKQVEALRKTRPNEHVNDYAVSVDKMTNLLWYKLGNGFGQKEYPNNVNSVLKAKTILASYISHNIETVYNEAKEQYRNGKITKEMLLARIVTLRKKPTLPEEIEGDNIDENLNFSPEFLRRYEEEVISNKKQLECLKKEYKLHTLEKDKTIEEKDLLLQEKSEENKALEEELKQYREKEKTQIELKQKRKRIIRFIWSLVWRAGVFVFLIVALWIFKEKIDSNLLSFVFMAIDIISICIFIFSVLGEIKNKYFKKK